MNNLRYFVSYKFTSKNTADTFGNAIVLVDNPLTDDTSIGQLERELREAHDYDKLCLLNIQFLGQVGDEEIKEALRLQEGLVGQGIISREYVEGGND